MKDEREATGMNNEKDNPFTIFHALGKFLYNKSNLSSYCII